MSDLRYRQIHLDFHTSEYIPKVGCDFDAELFAEQLAQANVNSITCFGRCHHGWLYYPSKKFPELIHPQLANHNLLLQQIESCHKRGIKVPIYTTAQWDGRIMRSHPEWLAQDENGEYIDTQNVPKPHFYHTICLNSGYRHFFHAQLKDMIAVVKPENVDGIFVDILFQVDCKCPICVEKMKQLGKNPESKKERLDYAVHMLEEFKSETTALVHLLAPKAGIFYNSSHIGPAYKKSFKDYSHLELESLPSGGWGYDHFPATSRYARKLGKEMLGMTGKFHTYWGDFHSLKNQVALELECNQMLAMGAGCSIGDQLHPSGRLSEATYDLIGKIYAEVKKKEPFCRNAKAKTEIAVLNPEEFYPDDSYDTSISPSLIGAVRMLQELCYQFDVIDMEMDLSSYQILILPDCIYYNEKLEQVIEAYLAKGGKVIGSYKSCLPMNGDLSIYGVKYLGKSEFYRDFVMPNDTIGKDLPKEEFVMYLRGLAVESVYAEVLMDTIVPYFDRGPDMFCSHQHAPSSRKAGTPAVTQCENIIYFSHPIFHLYRKNAPRWCKLMVKDAIEYLMADKLVSHDGPSTLQMTLNHQEAENRDVLHVLHYITEKRSEDIFTLEDVIPLYSIKVKIYVGENQVKAIVDPIGNEYPAYIAFIQKGSYIYFTLPEVRGHKIICIKL
ncbi:beta-galactosidase trimerization domain-containing protein [Lachnospiraceae bacterium ZAX-1]